MDGQDLAAERAYEAFLRALPALHLPQSPVPWPDVPESLKQAWRAAAAAARGER